MQLAVPGDLKYTRTHEWARVEKDGSVTIGITDHAQSLLGEVVFVSLPETGAEFKRDQECAVAESVKAAADIYCPVAGKVQAVNAALTDHSQLINQDAYGEGWLFKVIPHNQNELNELLTAQAYQQQLQES